MSFENAVSFLNSRRARAKSSLNDMQGSDDMILWLKLLGYDQDDLRKLNIIHVAGTNGKGSTCAYISSILQGCGYKVGLYTSPHLLSICERIRIDGKAIEEDKFAKYFFQIWGHLPSEPRNNIDIPRYLQLLTLLSLHVFITERVDVAVYETHMGGRVDATNVVASPIVTALTHIGEDHAKLLGPTIEDIAWQKAGIFKSGCPAFSAPQEDAVVQVLNQCAKENPDVNLSYVTPDSSLRVPEFQRENCSLARAVALAWIRKSGTPGIKNLTEIVDRSVQTLDWWQGRYQQVEDRNKLNHTWFLDGAHNKLGLYRAVLWFARMSKSRSDKISPMRILIFSHFSDRDGVELLEVINNSLEAEGVEIEHMILTTYNERDDGKARIDRNLRSRSSTEKLESYRRAWIEYQPQTAVHIQGVIEKALNQALELSENRSAHVLITGSLHLVSGALRIMGNEAI